MTQTRHTVAQVIAAVRGLAAGAGGGVGLPDAGQVIEAQQLRQHARVHLGYPRPAPGARDQNSLRPSRQLLRSLQRLLPSYQV